MFDEADRLLTDESFKADLTEIMEALVPQKQTRDLKGNGRQTFLFSATMASDYDRHISKELLYGEGYSEK